MSWHYLNVMFFNINMHLYTFIIAHCHASLLLLKMLESIINGFTIYRFFNSLPCGMFKSFMILFSVCSFSGPYLSGKAVVYLKISLLYLIKNIEKFFFYKHSEISSTYVALFESQGVIYFYFCFLFWGFCMLFNLSNAAVSCLTSLQCWAYVCMHGPVSVIWTFVGFLV